MLLVALFVGVLGVLRHYEPEVVVTPTQFKQNSVYWFLPFLDKSFTFDTVDFIKAETTRVREGRRRERQWVIKHSIRLNKGTKTATELTNVKPSKAHRGS